MDTHPYIARAIPALGPSSFVFAALAIAAAAYAFAGTVDRSLLLATCAFAVAIVALLLGTRAAIFAASLSLVIALTPLARDSRSLFTPAFVAHLALFLAGSSVICVMAARLRRHGTSSRAQPTDTNPPTLPSPAARERDNDFGGILQVVPALLSEGEGGGICYSRDQWCAYTGMTPQQAAGWGWLDAVHPEDAPSVEAKWERSIALGVSYEIKHRVRRADGSYHWFVARAAPLRTDVAGMVHWSGSLIDIDDLVRTEEELRQTHGQLAAVLQNMSDGFVALDQDRRFLYVNSAAAALICSSPERLLGRPVQDICPSCNCKEIIDHLQKAAAAQTTSTFEFFSNVLGRWYECRCYPASQWLTMYFNDITERKRAEQQIRENEERVRIALEAADVGFWEWRLDTGQVHWSAQMYHVIGRPPEYFGRRHQHVEEIGALLHPEDRQRFYDRMNHAINTRSRFECEYRLALPGGEIRWISDVAQAYYDQNGAATRMTGIMANITHRKAAEEALANAKKAAEQMNQAKDRFLAVLSHELRTPLTPVLAGVTMLQEQTPAESETGHALAMVRRNVEMEARLIDDLLDVARIGRGKIELQKRMIAIGQPIAGAVEVCMAEIKRRNLTLHFDIKEAGQKTILADPARIQQIFWNLLSNAVKFTPEGGEISIACDVEDGFVITEVSDTGAGIAPSLLPHIFNAFQQGGAEITRQFGGLGLGLTITHNLVRMHGGSITAISEGKGKGATFRVRLPIAAGATALKTKADPTPPEERLLRVLLVEDHADTAMIMARLLRAAGHEVMISGTAAGALELAQTQPFDLLVSDVGLPDSSGIDLMLELRRRGLSLRGIALSGYGQEEDIHRSEQAGFVDHLVKPVSAQRLRSAVLQAGARTAG